MFSRHRPSKSVALRTLLKAWEKRLEAVSPSPRAELLFLLAELTGRPPTHVLLLEELPPEVVRRAEALIARRVRERTPFPYLLRRAYFFGLPLYVDERVLIPRPETELLVEEALRRIPRKHGWVVDVGTGSGAIALAVAQNRPDLHVVGTDLSAAALQVARRNARQLNLPVNLVRCDLLEAFAPRPIFAAILSNPPYLSPEKAPSLPPEVLKEPHQALFSGPTGAEIALRLIETGLPRLRENGLLILEIDPSIRDYLPPEGEVLQDLAGQDRIYILKKEAVL